MISEKQKLENSEKKINNKKSTKIMKRKYTQWARTYHLYEEYVRVRTYIHTHVIIEIEIEQNKN